MLNLKQPPPRRRVRLSDILGCQVVKRNIEEERRHREIARSYPRTA